MAAERKRFFARLADRAGRFVRRMLCNRFLVLLRVLFSRNTRRRDPDAEGNPATLAFTDYFEYTKQCLGYDLTAYGSWQDQYSAMMDAAFLLRGKRVLDVGCAAGSLPYGFLKRGAKVRGLEINEDVAVTSPFYRVPIYVIPTDRFAELFPPDFFDLVHSSQVFEHFPGKDYSVRVVDCVYQTLKPGGIVYASFVAGDHLNAGKLLEMARTDPAIDVTHVNIWPLQWWEEVFHEAGFHDVTGILGVIVDCFQAADGFSFFREYEWTQKVWMKRADDNRIDRLRFIAVERLKTTLESQALYADGNVYRNVMSRRVVDPLLEDVIRQFLAQDAPSRGSAK